MKLIRILLVFCLLITIISPFTVDDELIFPMIFITLILYLTDLAKIKMLDTIIIIITWVLIGFGTYLNFMTSGYASSQSTLLNIGLIGLLGLLTLFNHKINYLLKRNIKKPR